MQLLLLFLNIYKYISIYTFYVCNAAKRNKMKTQGAAARQVYVHPNMGAAELNLILHFKFRNVFFKILICCACAQKLLLLLLLRRGDSHRGFGCTYSSPGVCTPEASAAFLCFSKLQQTAALLCFSELQQTAALLIISAERIKKRKKKIHLISSCADTPEQQHCNSGS